VPKLLLGDADPHQDVERRTLAPLDNRPVRLQETAKIRAR
jgi:hypothetical protein